MIDLEKTKLAPPDLDEARDEKCMPIARAILSDMVAELLPEDLNSKVDFHPITLKILQKYLDADLNMTTDTPYIPQLILGALSGLNGAANGAEMKPVDDVRYGTITRRILKVLYDANLPMTNIKKEEMDTVYAPLRVELSKIFLEESMTVIEVKYVMDNIFMAFNTLTNMLQVSLEESSKRAEAKLFGISDITDLTMKKLQEVLLATPVGEDSVQEDKAAV